MVVPWCCHVVQEEAFVEEKVRGLLISLPKGAFSEAEAGEFGQRLQEINPGLIVKRRRGSEGEAGFFVYFTGATSGYAIIVGGGVVDVVPGKTIHITPELGVECLPGFPGEGQAHGAIDQTKMKQQNHVNSVPSPSRCNMDAAKPEPPPDSRKTCRKVSENELGRVQVSPPRVNFPSPPSCSRPVRVLSEGNLKKKDDPKANISSKAHLKNIVDRVNPIGSPSPSMRESIFQGRRYHNVVVKPNIQVLLPSLDTSNGLWAAVEKQLGVDIRQLSWDVFQFMPWFFIAYDYHVFFCRVWRSPAWMPTIYIRLGCPLKYIIFVLYGAFFDQQNFGRTAFYRRLLLGYIMHMLAAERPNIPAHQNGRQAMRHR